MGVSTYSKVALAITMFLITGVFGFLQPFVPLYLEAAHLGKSQIGLVTALGTGVALLIQPLLGRLSDKFDTRRPFLVLAALCAATAYLTFRAADGFLAFVALTALGVNGFQYLNSVGGVLIGRMVQAEGGNAQKGGTAYVGYRLWGSVGYIVIAVTTGVLIRANLPPNATLTRTDLDPVFTYGPLLFFLIAAMAFVVPDVRTGTRSPKEDSEKKREEKSEKTQYLPPSPPALSREYPDDSFTANSSGIRLRFAERRSPNTSHPRHPLSRGGTRHSGSARWGTRRFPSEFADLRDGAVQDLKPDTSPNAFFMAYFLYSFGLYGASAYLSLYMKQLGADPLLITGMFAAGVIVEVLVMTRIGRWTDRFGRRPALAASFLLMPIRLLLYVPANGPLWVVAVQMLHGINFGIVGTIAIVFINDLARDHERGLMQAKLATTAGIGTALGPLVCGVLAEKIGIAGMFAAMSVVGMLAAFLFIAFVKESHPSPETPRGLLRYFA